MDACPKGMSADGTFRVIQTEGGSSEADVCPKGMYVYVKYKKISSLTLLKKLLNFDLVYLGVSSGMCSIFLLYVIMRNKGKGCYMRP